MWNSSLPRRPTCDSPAFTCCCGYGALVWSSTTPASSVARCASSGCVPVAVCLWLCACGCACVVTIATTAVPSCQLFTVEDIRDMGESDFAQYGVSVPAHAKRIARMLQGRKDMADQFAFVTSAQVRSCIGIAHRGWSSYHVGVLNVCGVFWFVCCMACVCVQAEAFFLKFYGHDEVTIDSALATTSGTATTTHTPGSDAGTGVGVGAGAGAGAPPAPLLRRQQSLEAHDLAEVARSFGKAVPPVTLSLAQVMKLCAEHVYVHGDWLCLCVCVWLCGCVAVLRVVAVWLCVWLRRVCPRVHVTIGCHCASAV